MTDKMKCTWTRHSGDDPWSTSCRNAFTLEDGSPSDNGMEFCCYCGKPLEEMTDEDGQFGAGA